MASLLDKLTGKAPFKEVEETDENKVDNDKSADTSEKASSKLSKPKKVVPEQDESAPKVYKRPSMYNVEDFKTIGLWLLPMACCGLILLLVSLFAGKLNEPYMMSLATQNESHNSLLNQIDIKENEYKDKLAQESIMDEYVFYAGDDSEKFLNDKAIAEEFLKKYTTWSTGEEFTNLKKEILGYDKDHDGIMEYQLESSFIKNLFPEQFTYTVKETGEIYYSSDVYGYTSKFKSLEPYALAYNNDMLSMSYGSILTIDLTKFDENGNLVHTDKKYYITYNITKGEILNVQLMNLVEDPVKGEEDDVPVNS